MFSPNRIACGLAVCGLVLSACASAPSSDKPLVLARETDGYFQQYLHEVQQGRAGAFAVSEDGNASFYSICESGGCNGQYNFSKQAVQGCEKFGHGHCVVLSSNGVIKRQYTVAK